MKMTETEEMVELLAEAARTYHREGRSQRIRSAVLEKDKYSFTQISKLLTQGKFWKAGEKLNQMDSFIRTYIPKEVGEYIDRQNTNSTEMVDGWSFGSIR